MRRTTLLLLALLSVGCASRGPAVMTRIETQRCDAHLGLENAAVIELDAAQAQVHHFDGQSRCQAGAVEDAAMSYAVYRLPRYREDWTLEVDSRIEGRSLFAPELLTLDGEGRVVRQFGFDRFVLRGDELQATVFFGAADARERYVVLRSAPERVGRQEQRVVSGSFFIPIVTGLMPLIYLQGTESEDQYTLSHSGVVALQGRSARAQARQPHATRDLARAELGARLR